MLYVLHDEENVRKLIHRKRTISNMVVFEGIKEQLQIKTL